jgi:GT2 family glycosyltransferase
VGNFDEGFFLYHEEIDLCWRMRKAGWEVWSLPGAQVIHFDAQASGFRANRLPGDPVLSWRIIGMDRLWFKHRKGFPHRAWRFQTRTLLLMRVLLIQGGALLGYRDRDYRRHRVDELLALRGRLGSTGNPESP